MASPAKEHGRLDPAFTWRSLERATDERLVALARSGVDVAVETIVRRYQTALVSYASRFVDPERAQHVAQEALVKGLAEIEGDSRRVQLRSWLFRVVHNEAVNTARRRNTRDEPRDEDDGDEKSAEYRARVERLRNVIIGINKPAAAYAEASEQGREQVSRELAEATAVVEALIRRARARVRTTGGALDPRQPIANLVEKLRAPAMGGVVMAGAAAVVVAMVVGAAALSTHSGGPDSGTTTPSASSAPDQKPRVAGPRRSGGTRTRAAEAKAPRHAAAPDRVQQPSSDASPEQAAPTVVGGSGGTVQETKPKRETKPKAKKPSNEGDTGGEEVTVLGKRQGATGSGAHGKTQAPNGSDVGSGGQ